MSLPKLNTDIVYETKLPSNGKKVKYRPFFVKEEKILLMAMEDKTLSSMIQSVKNIISNCTFGEINVEEMAMVDLEWMIIQLRMKSKGEINTVHMKCDGMRTDIDGESPAECVNTIKIDVDLREVYIKNEDAEKVIPLTDTIGMKMKLPTAKVMDMMVEYENTKNNKLNDYVIASCIESIYDGDQVHNADDYKAEELIAFIDNLNTSQSEKLSDFFSNLPTVAYKYSYECNDCGHIKESELVGLRNFFV